ncbi:TPA: peptidase S8, partial [Vibrio parahaemolyticus]
KWSPVKAYHHIFPQGVSIDTWRLKLKVERRAEEQKPEVPQRVSLVVSLRALDPSQPVYNEAIRKMNQSGWVTHDIDVNVRVRQ